MNPGELRNKIDVYEHVKTLNSLGESDYDYEKTKSIWSKIYPEFKGNVQSNQADKSINYAETTHIIKCRKLSIKEPSIDMYFKYQNLKYEVLFFQPDFQNNEFWQFKCKVVYE